MAAIGAGALLEWIGAGIATLFVGEVATQEIKKQVDKKPDTTEPDPQQDPDQKPQDKPVPAPPDLGKKCDKCPPDCGSMVRTRFTMSEVSRRYQGRITGFAFGVEDWKAGWNDEWFYNGVNFDGFKSGQCLLQEAKAEYDWMFDEIGKPEPYYQSSLDKMITDAQRQLVAAGPPPRVRLRWYFMTPLAFRYFQRRFVQTVPTLEIEFAP